MPREEVHAGACPKCQADTLACRYNYFSRDGLTINSWEHRCGDCGYRVTTAYRSDAVANKPPNDLRICPYCGRQAATP